MFFLKSYVSQKIIKNIYIFFLHFSRVKFSQEEEREDEEQESGLLVELEGKDEKKERETNLWFSKVCLFILSLNKLNCSSDIPPHVLLMVLCYDVLLI